MHYGQWRETTAEIYKGFNGVWTSLDSRLVVVKRQHPKRTR